MKAGSVRVVPAIAVIPVLAPRVGLASVSAFVSVMETVAPVEFSVTAPVKSLPTLARVITPVPALKVAEPAPDAWVIAPLCVMPTAVTVRVPLPKVEAPKSIVFASVIATLLAPELFKLTEPVKLLLALVSVITPAPALKVTAPAPAVWVMIPEPRMPCCEVIVMAPVPVVTGPSTPIPPAPV